MTRTCPECGKPVEANALNGLCPECLLRIGLGSHAGQTEATGPGPHRKSASPPAPGDIAPHFPQLEILELLGWGGMGAVYKARQRQLDRLVALKILPPGIAEGPAFAERFTREARALAKLNHPGIVTLYEFGRADGLFYFLMEFVDGVSLRHVLDQGRMSSREALAIVPQICDALQYAHDQGIVHRDIKPENILLDRRGRVKVADFGVAKLVEPGSEPAGGRQTAAGIAALTQAGKVMGTPKYMAPEQREHPAEVDHRADIYALGVVLYQMLTGELPGKPIEPPSAKVEVDVRLDEVVLRALQNKPELRYQQASALKTDVETISAATRNTAPTRDPEAKVPEHMPRAAVWGLIWLAVFVIAFVTAYTPPGWALTAALRDAIGNKAAGLLISAPLALIGLGAPVGTTALGFVALRHIRYSRHTRGMGIALFDALLFPVLLLNGWMFWLAWRVGTQIGLAGPSGGLPGWAVAAFVPAAVAADGWIARAAWQLARKYVQSPPPPRARTAAPDVPLRRRVGRATVRAGLVTIVHLALLETIQQASVHRPESYGELRNMALFTGSLAAMVWVAWPLRTRRFSVLLRGGLAVGLFALLSGLDSVYLMHLRPNFGLYEESDWVAQHPGFQWGWRQDIGNNVWNKPKASAFAPAVELILPLHGEQPATLLDLDHGNRTNRTRFDVADPGMLTWARSENLDLAIIPRDGQAGAVGLALKAAWVPRMALEKPVTPQQVVNFWVLDNKPPSQTYDFVLRTNLVGTFVFRTRENGSGLLEFLGPDEHSRGLKIRYRLVNGRTAEPAPVAAVPHSSIGNAPALLRGT